MAAIINHLLYSFAKYSDEALDAFVEKVLASMTTNPNFTTPDPPLATIQTALETFRTAVTAKAQGGPLATKARDAARAALIDLMRQLGHYIEKTCNNDPVKMMSSGFGITSASHTQFPLDTPAITSATNGQSGTILLHAMPIRGMKSLRVRYRETGTTAWLDGPPCTQTRNIPVPGLTPGKTYDFCLQAIGGSTGQTDWSDVVSHMAT